MPRIFYHCYDHNRPTGGQKDTYQHVDVLNRFGLEAYAVHAEPGFRLTWFENTTPVIDANTFRTMHDVDRDYVVLPEDLGEQILSYPGRKIIFNKNVYLGCRALRDGRVDPYSAADVVGIFAVSEHNARLLRLAYPEKVTSVVHYDIRADRFPRRPLREKAPQIACLPKAPGQISVVYQTLRARAASGHNRLSSFTWVLAENMSEQHFSVLLQESLILVFLSVEEGLPRVPLEAICAGCFVASYRSGPLRECLPADCGVEYGDVQGLIEFIEGIAARFPDGLAEDGVFEARRERVVAAFSAERQAADVALAWEGILRPRRVDTPSLPARAG
jgi:hypothetical protein